MWLQSSTRELWQLQYFKLVFLKMSIVTIRWVFPNLVTYKCGQCPLLESIAAWQRYHVNNYLIILLMYCELYVCSINNMKHISGSQNLIISRDIRLLCNRDEASQAWPTPTIRTYLYPRYHANTYTYSMVLNYCELYVALWSLYIWQVKFPLPETLANMFSIRLCIIKLAIIMLYTNKSYYSLCQP